MKKSIGICFDLDGTLLDSGPEGLKRFLKVAKSRNLPVTPEIEVKLKSIWGQSVLSLIKCAWPETDWQAFYNDWEKLDIEEGILPIFPGVKEALEKLSKYFYLSLLSNRTLRTILPQVDKNGILHFFQFCVASEETKFKKPDPQSMNPVFARYKLLGVEPRKIILVGDTIEGDWRLANNLGLEFFAVTSGGMNTKESFLKQGVAEDHILNSVADLPDTLLGE